MADEMTGTYEPPKRALHEAGSFAGVCVDFVNLGKRKRTYQDSGKAYLISSAAWVFYCGETDPETGEPLFLAREFDVKLAPKANCRKFLEGWRGKEYTQEELERGIEFHKAVGRAGTVSVIHNTPKDRTFANIESVKTIAKGLVPPVVPANHPYVRAPYWQKVKDKYAAEVAEFDKQFGAQRSPEQDDSSFEDETPF